MKILDLSHTLSPEMPVYPGAVAPVISDEYRIDHDGYYECKTTLFSHTGTHIDAPAHLIKGAKTLDQFPKNPFAKQYTHYRKSGPFGYNTGWIIFIYMFPFKV